LKRLSHAIVPFAALALSGCNTATGAASYLENVVRGDPQVPLGIEYVLAPNATITATTSVGQIVVKAGKGLRRTYMWEGATRWVVMEPRRERWYGSLGMYYSGAGSHWFPHNGISRGVLEEGQQNFSTLEEATKWLRDRTQWLPFVYTQDGLVVSWGKTLEREQLNVEVWQLCVMHRKPNLLSGAADANISISSPTHCS
jgi:hypothetical protein